MGEIAIQHALRLCGLLRGYLQDQPVSLEDVDWQAIYDLAKKQSLVAIAYAALEKAGGLSRLEPSLAAKWSQEKAKAVRKNILLTQGRWEICKKLDEAGIWYMPLKGSILAELYPGLGLRQMTDNDILFDPAGRKQVKKIMVELGYEVEEYCRGNHDTYLKQPVYNYEMHVALIGENHEKVLRDYYRDVHLRLQPGEGMLRYFRDEDFYVFQVAHGYKHFSTSGNGLRYLLDCQIYTDKKPDMDWQYISGELSRLGLGQFDEQTRCLARKLLVTGEALTEGEAELVAFCVRSGTYGTLDIQVERKIQALQGQAQDGKEGGRSIRWRYLWRRLWPEPQWFLQYYPFLAKYPALKPFFLLWRAIKGLLFRGKAIREEMDMATRHSQQQ